MADSRNRGSDASLFGGENGTLPPKLNSSSSQRRRNRVGGATPFSDFSAFRGVIRQECEIAKAERLEAARASNRRQMEEAFELKL